MRIISAEETCRVGVFKTLRRSGTSPRARLPARRLRARWWRCREDVTRCARAAGPAGGLRAGSRLAGLGARDARTRGPRWIRLSASEIETSRRTPPGGDMGRARVRCSERHGVNRKIHAGRRRHRASAAVRGPGGRGTVRLASRTILLPPASAFPEGSRITRRARGGKRTTIGVHARARGGRHTGIRSRCRRPSRRVRQGTTAMPVHGGRDPGATPGDSRPRRAKVVQPSTSKRCLRRRCSGALLGSTRTGRAARAGFEHTSCFWTRPARTSRGRSRRRTRSSDHVSESGFPWTVERRRPRLRVAVPVRSASQRDCRQVQVLASVPSGVADVPQNAPTEPRHSSVSEFVAASTRCATAVRHARPSRRRLRRRRRSARPAARRRRATRFKKRASRKELHRDDRRSIAAALGSETAYRSVRHHRERGAAASCGPRRRVDAAARRSKKLADSTRRVRACERAASSEETASRRETRTATRSSVDAFPAGHRAAVALDHRSPAHTGPRRVITKLRSTPTTTCFRARRRFGETKPIPGGRFLGGSSRASPSLRVVVENLAARASARRGTRRRGRRRRALLLDQRSPSRVDLAEYDGAYVDGTFGSAFDVGVAAVDTAKIPLDSGVAGALVSLAFGVAARVRRTMFDRIALATRHPSRGRRARWEECLIDPTRFECALAQSRSRNLRRSRALRQASRERSGIVDFLGAKARGARRASTSSQMSAAAAWHRRGSAASAGTTLGPPRVRWPAAPEFRARTAKSASESPADDESRRVRRARE